MKGILDEEEAVIKNESNLFSNLSFFTCLVSLLFIILAYFWGSKPTSGNQISYIFLGLIYLILGSNIFGVIIMLTSVVKKESWTVYKCLGIIVNTLLLVLIVGAFVALNNYD